MQSRYSESNARTFIERYAREGEDLALRVYTSRLLGQDPTLVLHGGGNTSVKSRARELTGESVDVLYVKGSGWDLGNIEPAGFPACRLDPLRRQARLAELSDEEMVKGLRSQMLDPASPTPSVEALLHAFLPQKFVDHTHASAVLTVVDQPDGAERAREVWGDGLLVVPYVMPGFVLAKRIVELEAELAKAEVMVLDKHGIFTWGSSARESYERMIAAVDRAEAYVKKNARVSLGVPAALDPAERRARQRALSPVLRGALARAPEGQRFLVSWRDEPEVLALLARDDAARVTQVGTVTPDHVIRTKPTPLFLPATDRESVEQALGAWSRNYVAYFERGVSATKRELRRLDALPRLVVVPGLGAACLGASLKEAKIAGDIWFHSSSVIQAAASMGGYRPVAELDLFDVEYWSLEQAKLGKSSAGKLARKIALVTGAASGIGRATAELFLELGAHVVLTDFDADKLEAARAELAKKHGDRVAGARADVTQAADVTRAFELGVDTFGGLDLVVSNAGTAPTGLLHEEAGEKALLGSLEVNLLGHQRVARAASEIFLAQGMGGCLLFNASKSAFNQGPEFGPYAIAKAGVVALMKQYAVDLGPKGIRANAINADRIRTDLFGGGVLEARAKARGISPDAYFRQNLLGRETLGRDCAEAFLHLATAEATTGAVIPVDGGNAAAFPR